MKRYRVTIIDNIFPAESSWSEIKTFVEHTFGFSNDALHVLVGLVLQVLAAAILATSLRSLRPWFLVLVLAIANEGYDLAAETWPNQAEQAGEGAKDVLLTMALPSLFLILARYSPGLLVPPAGGAEAEDQES